MEELKAEAVSTNQQIVLSVRMKGDDGPQVGDVVLQGNTFSDFKPGESYVKDEVVLHDGDFYRAKYDLDPSEEFNPEDWECITDIVIRIDNFIPNHKYLAHEVIKEGNQLYRAPIDFTASDTFNLDDWEEIDSVNTIVETFAKKTEYLKGEIVIYDGKLYRAKKAFTSSDAFRLLDWEIIGDVIIENFEGSRNYTKGNIIISGGKLYRAKQDFTSGSAWQPEYWESVNSAGIGEFAADTYYPKGSIIYVDGKIYVAKEDFTSQSEFNQNDWQIVSETKAVDYNNFTLYQKDQIVFYEGKLYKAKEDFTSGNEFDPSAWQLISSSTTSSFEAETTYLQGTVIYHEGILWIAKKDFTSGAQFDPKDWDPLTETEQETYESWSETGTIVKLPNLVERFENATDKDIWLQNIVNTATSSIEASNTNAFAKLETTAGHSNMTLEGRESSFIITNEGLNLTNGDTYFRVDSKDKKVEISEDLASALTNTFEPASNTTKGLVKVDQKTIKVKNETITSYPIPQMYTVGYTYEKYELCTYRDQIYASKDNFTAKDWDPTQWLPVKQVTSEYAANETYKAGDLIVDENDQIYICQNDITSAPASRVAEDWSPLQISGDNVVLEIQGNLVAISKNLNEAIGLLDAKVRFAVQPLDGATNYLFTVQESGTQPPASVNGKTIICLFTE